MLHAKKNMFIFVPNMKATNNISFKSRINILSPYHYAKSPASQNIIHFFQDAKHKNVVMESDFCTKHIRTCIGGGLMSQNKSSAIGFHIWDELKYKDLQTYIKYIKKLMPKADNGLLIGSKSLNDAEHSIPYFNKIQEQLLEVCPNISYFKTFTQPYGQADFTYLRDIDTWNIRLSSLKPYSTEMTHIYKLKDFLKFFKEISIAPTDTLFINGKQITKTQVPEIFR